MKLFRIFKLSALSLLIFGISLTTALAEPAEVFITAGLVPVENTKAPGSSSLDYQLIQDLRSPSIEAILQTEADLHIDRTGGPGGFSSIYLRGSDPNYTTVLLDGIKLNDSSDSRGGAIDFSSLDPQAIGEIEIFRGASSSVYGSDAMAGAINILSYKPENSETRILTEGGFFEAVRGSVNTYQYFSDSYLALGASARRGGEELERDRLWRRDLHLTAEHYPSDNTKLRFVSRWELTNSRRFPDDSGGSEFAIIRQTEKKDAERVSAGIFFETEQESGVFKANISYLRSEAEIDSPGVAPGARDPFGLPASLSETVFERYSAQANYLINLMPTTQLALGAEHQFETGEENGFLDFGEFPAPTDFDLDRSISSGFLELVSEPLENLLVRTGVRVDWPESFSTQASPSATLAYKVQAISSSLFAKYNQGYKLPSFYALGNPLVGNTELKAEKSKTWEVGVENSSLEEQLKTSVSWFISEFKNAIDFEEGPPPSLVNRSKVESSGLELRSNYQLAKQLRAGFSLAYIENEIKDSEQKLRNRPDWRSTLRLAWDLCEKTTSTLSAGYTGERFDSSIPNGDLDLDDFYLVNFILQHRFNQTYSSWLAIDNLLNEEYQHYDGFEAPGITGRIGLEIKL